MATKPTDILRDGKLIFFKYEENWTSRNAVRLHVDPTPYILYWRYKDPKVFNTKELAYEKNYIYLERIYDVRAGKPTDFELVPSERSYEPNFLTIVSGTSITNLKFTHFVCMEKNEKRLHEFAATLFTVVQRVKREEHGLLYHFRKKLAPKMYAAFTRRCIEEDIMKVFDKHRKNSTKIEWTEVGKLLPVNRKSVEIDDQKLIKIIMILTKFEGSRLEAIFRKISEDEPVATKLEFGDWLRKNQHDHRLNDARFNQVSDRKINSILENWQYSSDSAISPQMFTHWMVSDECGVAISAQRMKMDVTSMREPINKYFINSSHNTYCSGNQLVYAIGHCSADVEMYRQALLSGSRCVELDMWDNKDKDGEPVITHGPTAVMGMNEIGLKEVCEAIKECAFKTSPYPVILSIENHLGRKQQEKMVQIFRQVFGELLLTGPLPDYPLYAKEGAGDVVYPPPELLKHKILIKAKKKRFEKQESRSRDSSSIDLQGSSIDLTEDEEMENERFNELTEEQKAAQLSELPEETTCSELSAITNYMQAYETSRGVSTVVNLENATKDIVPCIVSADENTVYNCLRANSIDKVQNLNKSKITRIYPKASRIYSTNYNPMIHWLTGSQMVSLNIQTNCSNMQLNYAMFERNGGCGYVRKPDWLRARNVQLRPFLSIPFTIAYTVEVEIIAAYFLSSMDSGKFRRRSSVSIRLFDVPDQISKDDAASPSVSTAAKFESSCRRRTREEASFVTNYERHVYSFDKIMLNDMSFIQFNVHNESGSVFAQRILHIDTMNNGYRFVTLRTPSNQCAGPACLLVRFDLFMHSDRKNLHDLKQMYNPHAFEKESDKWERRFSNPFADLDKFDDNEFLLVEGTRRGSVEHAPTTPTTPTKPMSFGKEILEKISFWKKK
ncbi:Phosphoinositide phospholipase C [Caenorhabditis elegans]|uniref:Phosphoinositide phospholipase C n=1 Tax=Caenorhabditis elegans TaxID=6239 RepID=Q9XWB7_CAEEL|nr:Phosphoinositide phospholipase C [Caenorhabditis elegans]CAA21765.1 Phosphoinositide phospholipase C [Caenorhabditis elegans]|eukprot:NP_506752.1 Phosphoinositide phospholipase C [Caenorhabditis elegans]